MTGEGLDEAMQGVDAVAHTASPYALTVKDPMKDFITPAVDGTISVLRAAKVCLHGASSYLQPPLTGCFPDSF